jgi:hypothetical protein
MKATSFIVVDALGYYGDFVAIHSSHKTAAAAIKAAKHPGKAALAGCDKKKGDRIPRGVLEDMIACGHWQYL